MLAYFEAKLPRLTTLSEKGITSLPIEISGEFKAFTRLIVWLEPKIMALVLLAFSLMQLVSAHKEI